ncbi:MAG: hypothetical protein V4501_08700 [Pseudomonadota bacterium]
MPKNNKRLFKNLSPRGLTLIELLMALASTLFLLLALATMLITLQKNFNTEETLNTLQENARAAMQILQTHIHNAGNIGCAKLQEGFAVKSFGAYSLSSQNKLVGTAHEITVRGAGGISGGLIHDMNDKNSIYITAKPVFEAGDLAIIADCETAEIFQIKNITIVTPYIRRIESITPLAKNYLQTATISRFEINTFSVERTSSKDNQGKAVTALYVKNRHHRKMELVEDIANLIFTYDVKINQRLQSLTAEQVTDWSSVVGITIHFQVKHFPFTKHWYTYIAV